MGPKHWHWWDQSILFGGTSCPSGGTKTSSLGGTPWLPGVTPFPSLGDTPGTAAVPPPSPWCAAPRATLPAGNEGETSRDKECRAFLASFWFKGFQA